MMHSLKTWSEHFELVRTNKKLFEIRKNDRAFEIGDYLALKEWSPINRKFSGRVLYFRITCIYQGERFGLKDGFVVLGLSRRVNSSLVKRLFANA